MGDASESDRVTALRLGMWAWWLLGGAFFWPVLAILFLADVQAWPRALWIGMGPSLVLVGLATILFIKARR